MSGRRLDRLGGLRGRPAAGAGQEWLHLSLRQGELDLIVNLSLAWQAGSEQAVDEARVMVIAGEGGRFVGALHQPSAARARLGPSAITLEGHRLQIVGDTLTVEISGALPLSLTLQATLPPDLSHRLPLGGGATLDWLVLPRMRCVEGWVDLPGGRRILDGAIAYHDHNWGAFSFGQDFSWEWGFVLPEEADQDWAIVFSRLGDRAQHRTRSQGLLFYQGGRLRAAFTGGELQIEATGALRRAPGLTLPPAAGLVLPPQGLGVPGGWTVRARAPGRSLSLSLVAGSTARIATPAGDEGLTLVYEVLTTAQIEVNLHGAELRAIGRGVTEAVRHHGA